MSDFPWYSTSLFSYFLKTHPLLLFLSESENDLHLHLISLNHFESFSCFWCREKSMQLLACSNKETFSKSFSCIYSFHRKYCTLGRNRTRSVPVSLSILHIFTTKFFICHVKQLFSYIYFLAALTSICICIYANIFCFGSKNDLF